MNCGANGTLIDVLSAIPAGESAAIRVTDLSNSKIYSYQAIHSMPFASIAETAKQLVQLNATHGQVLTWNNGDKKWEPKTVAAATSGTVTNVSVNSPLTISNPTSTPTIDLPQASATQSGYLSLADWTAFNNKEGSLTGGTSAQYYRGDKSWQTLDTSVVPENTNLYFTNARALGVPLTGFTTATGAIVATDTAIEAFGKAQGQINSLVTDSSKYLIKNSTDSITGEVNVGTIGLLKLNYAPVGMNDAVNKAYADTKLDLSGGTITGALNLDNDLKLKGGANYVTVKAHATSNNYNLVLPQTAGTSGYVLQTDGSGNLSWINPSSVAAGSGTVNSGSITDGSIVNDDINASAAIAQSKIANLTTDLAAKVSTTLASGNILVGNGSNVATAVSVSGDATLSNTGVLTLADTGTVGTYSSVTVDAKGRVTGGTNPAVVNSVSVTAPIVNSGTASDPVIAMPVATASANGYLSSSDFTTFNNKQDAIISSTAINAGSFISNLQGGLIVKPHNTGAGDTGEIQLKELAIGGSNYTGFKAPDTLAGNIIYTLPLADGSNGQVLTTNSTGGLSWTTVATSSTNLTGDIGGSIGANTIGAGKVTLTHLSATGTKDNTTYLRGDNTFASLASDVRAVALTGLSTATNAVITATDTVLISLGKLQKQISDFAVSAVGGDLSGNLPNPTVAKIQGKAVSSAAPLAGQVLKYNTGTPAWEPSYVLVGDLKSSALGNLFPGTGCAANQTLYYSVVGDAFTCVNIDSLDAGKITTGTIAAARLPVSATYWSAATGGINYAGGNVGVGSASPSSLLHVNGGTGNQLTVSESGGRQIVLSATSVNQEIKTSAGHLNLKSATGMTSIYGPGTAGVLTLLDSSATLNSLITASGDSYLMGGDVGIGTTNPLAKLHLGADSDMVLDGLTPFLVTRSTTYPTSGTETSGIGYTSEGSSGSTNLWPPQGSLSFLPTENHSATNKGTAIVLSTTPNTSTARVARMTIDHNGNVGIGTGTPGRMLHVQRSADDALSADVAIAQFDRKAVSGTPAAGIASFLQFGLPNSSNNVLLAADIGAKLTDVTPGSEKGILILRTTTAGGASEKVRVDHNGNVGIGNSNPQAKLEVNGAAVVGSTQGAKTIGVGSFFTTTSSAAHYIHIKTPFRPAVDAAMYHFKVEGYAYADSRDVDLTFVGYAYSANPTVIMNAQSRDPQGFFAPTQYIGSNGYIYLRFKPANIYYLTIRVDSTFVGNGKVVYPGELIITESTAATL